MTYASYLMRKRGECDKGKEEKMNNQFVNSLIREHGKEQTMKYTFRDGLTVEGTLAQVQQIARLKGETIGNDGVYYASSTRGLVRIADMDASHIRNAMLKRMREQADQLRGVTGRRLLQQLQANDNDVTIRALLVEYGKRVARGEE